MATGSGSGGDRKSSWNCFSCFSPKKGPSLQDPPPPVTEEEVVQPVPTVHAPPTAPATSQQHEQQGSNPADASGSSSVPSGESSDQNAELSADDIRNIWNHLDEEDHQMMWNCRLCRAVDKPRLNRWSGSCQHLFCDACLNEYVDLDVIIPANAWRVQCPLEGCTEMQTAEECRRFLPEEVGNLWVTSIPVEARNNIFTRREDERLASGINRGFVQGSSSNLNLPTEPEGPDGRQCRICRAVNKPRLNRWSDFCQHLFCDVCLNEYVDLNVIIETNAWRVQCPEEGCNETQTAEDCRRFLPQEVCDIWVASIPEEARNT